MVCGRRECCEDQLKRAGHLGRGRGGRPQTREGEAGVVGTCPLSGLTYLGGTSLVFPKSEHASCLASVPAAPAPHPLQLSEVQPQWFPTHVALLAKYRNDSVSGRGAAGRLPRVLLRPEGGKRGMGSLASPHSVLSYIQAKAGTQGVKRLRGWKSHGGWTPMTWLKSWRGTGWALGQAESPDLLGCS